jgi:hypothetical protein
MLDIVVSTQKYGEVALPPPAMVSDWLSAAPLTLNGSLPALRAALESVQPGCPFSNVPPGTAK